MGQRKLLTILSESSRKTELEVKKGQDLCASIFPLLTKPRLEKDMVVLTVTKCTVILDQLIYFI
jgi:hypothetical protein